MKNFTLLWAAIVAFMTAAIPMPAGMIFQVVASIFAATPVLLELLALHEEKDNYVATGEAGACRWQSEWNREVAHLRHRVRILAIAIAASVTARVIVFLVSVIRWTITGHGV